MELTNHIILLGSAVVFVSVLASVVTARVGAQLVHEAAHGLGLDRDVGGDRDAVAVDGPGRRGETPPPAGPGGQPDGPVA